MSEVIELAEVTVYRFDPSNDIEPRLVVYHAPYKGRTVINVLNYIYENQDASLAFRGGCFGKGSACCGACALSVNGRPVLGCQRVAEENMTIRPHPGFKVIKDLVCDFNTPSNMRGQNG